MSKISQQNLVYTNVSAKVKDTDGDILTNAYYHLNNLHPVMKPHAGLGLSNGTNFGDEKLKSAIVRHLAVGSKFKVHENVELFAALKLKSKVTTVLKLI